MPGHQVVIVGGGFGGLAAARALRRAAVQVTLIDRRNFHLFQPLLYQVATGALSPANIASPLRAILRRQKNCQVLLGDVVAIDAAGNRIGLSDGQFIPYDTLVIAAGATHSYFGNKEWPDLAPGLKTLEDATEIRARILSAFEFAERESDPAVRKKLLTFLVVGGGPTGVELAGAISETARHSLRRDFRSIDPSEATVILVEAGPKVLATFAPELSDKAAQSIERLGIQLRRNTLVTGIGPDEVRLKSGETVETIHARTVLWAAGIQAAPLAAALAAATGCPTDRAGRVILDHSLTLPGFPGIFVIGDMASVTSGETGKPLPGVAPVAIQQGEYVANAIRSRLRGRPVEPFEYRDQGSMATIGKAAAVADLGFARFSGFIAWILWLTVHLMQIVGFRNRLLVLFQWGWSYITYDRSARLITGPLPGINGTGNPPHSQAPDPSRTRMSPPAGGR